MVDVLEPMNRCTEMAADVLEEVNRKMEQTEAVLEQAEVKYEEAEAEYEQAKAKYELLRWVFLPFLVVLEGVEVDFYANMAEKKGFGMGTQIIMIVMMEANP